MAVIRVLLVSLLLHCSGQAVDQPGTSWPNAAVLDGGKYHLYWRSDPKFITFEVQVETLGYVGLGFSPDGRMSGGADLVIGWVKDDTPYICDMYSLLDYDYNVVVDSSQDYRLLSGYENDTHTVLSFQRAWNSCDVKEDVELTNDTFLLWAYDSDDGPTEGFGFSYHDRKGVYKASLEPPQNATTGECYPPVFVVTGWNVYLEDSESHEDSDEDD